MKKLKKSWDAEESFREIVTTAGLQTFVVMVYFWVGALFFFLMTNYYWYVLSPAHGMEEKYIVAKN